MRRNLIPLSVPTVVFSLASVWIELLAVGVRPNDINWNYRACRSSSAAALDRILCAVPTLQTKHPGSFFLISRDFNHASLYHVNAVTEHWQHLICAGLRRWRGRESEAPLQGFCILTHHICFAISTISFPSSSSFHILPPRRGGPDTVSIERGLIQPPSNWPLSLSNLCRKHYQETGKKERTDHCDRKTSVALYDEGVLYFSFSFDFKKQPTAMVSRLVLFMHKSLLFLFF